MPTIEKTIHVDQKVEDLWGLYLDLRKAAFKVKNVGADQSGTYVYLELDEDKDPAPIVETWVGKTSPTPSVLLRNVRVKELEKVKEEDEARMLAELEAQRKREEAQALGLPEPSLPVEDPSEPPSEKMGLLKRIFRKFF